MCSTRRNIQDELERELRASFWTRNFVINPLFVLACIVIVVIYVILPIYLYRERLPGVCCQPDEGTSLFDGCPTDGDGLEFGPGGGAPPDGPPGGGPDGLGGGPGARRLLEGGEAWDDPWAGWVARG